MKKKSVTFGRATPTNKVDFDLSLEGPAYKISHRQASVHYTDEGECVLHNEGRRVVFVDGRAVPSGRSARLESNQTSEVSESSRKTDYCRIFVLLAVCRKDKLATVYVVVAF